MILLQPTAQSRGDYLNFARTHSLGLELMDFAFPVILKNDSMAQALYSKYDGVLVRAFHGPFVDLNYSGGDDEIFEISKRRIRKCASHAYAMGVRGIVIHSCFFPTLTRDDPLYAMWSEEAAVLLRSVAEEYNVGFFIENVLDMTPDIISMMVREANHPCVKVCLDIGHANLSRTSLEGWMEALHEHIVHVHLSDNNAFYDDHIALGTGSVDCGKFDRLAKFYRLKADYTIEVKPFGAVTASFEYIKENMPYVFTEGSKA
ncbi:MAG: sugar phosphate isomerase/epimerase [Clostridia bacterium]|nr:sugar phosphate isomerase/epimerase [Clostridia bacterium]